jgi:ABC-2 type transport system permease protein
MTENTPRFGEVYDRRFGHYDGPRLGRRHAFGALIRYSIQRALGIKKRWTAKVVPIILYTVAAGAVLIVIGIEAFTGKSPMTYADFFIFTFALLGLFVATTAPEMICPDRRENVLTLYFARAIARFDYVLAKLAAMAILTLTISLAPQALFWLFRQLLADAPLAALKNNVDELAKIGLTGTLIAFYLGAIGLAVSSFTKRKPIAVTVIIVGWVMAEAFTGFTQEALRDRSWSDHLFLISPSRCSGSLAYSLLRGDDTSVDPEFQDLLAWWWYALGMAGTIAIACAITIWRYRPKD